MLQRFLQYLNSKNVPSTNVTETLIEFSYENLNYVFQYGERDDAYFIRLMLPRIDARNPSEEPAVYSQMVFVSSEIKVAKVVNINNSIWIVAEQFVYDSNNIEKLFDRMFSVLKSALNKYRSHEEKQTPGSADAKTEE